MNIDVPFPEVSALTAFALIVHEDHKIRSWPSISRIQTSISVIRRPLEG
jgi:hypothetical protein